MLPTLLHDVLEVILSHLEKRSDVINAGLVCRSLLPMAIRAIYREVVLHGPTCEGLLQLLARSPHTAIHVQKLELHAEETHKIEGPELSLLISHLARNSMRNLRKFLWNVPTAQQRDDMWYSLRRHCPLLKSIGTCFGVHVPGPSGSFFRFMDLRELHVIYRPAGINSATVEASIDMLWQVTEHNSPNLEGITMTGLGNSNEGAASVQRMLQCRWSSSLKRLCFQGVPVEVGSASRSGLHSGVRPFFAFLTAHPELEQVVMPPVEKSNQPKMLTDLSHYALRRVRIFEVTVMQLATLHNIAGLQSLCVTEPLHTWENSMDTITTALKDIRSLQRLQMGWRSHDSALSWSNLCSILACCPHLTDLDLTLSGLPMLSSDNFRKLLIHYTPRLSRLRLATTQALEDQPTMTAEARQLALALPSLTHVRLRYLALTILEPSTLPSQVERGDYEVVRTGPQPVLLVHAQCLLVDLLSPRTISQRTVKGTTQQWYQAQGATWCKQGPYRIPLDPSVKTKHSRTSSLSFLSQILPRRTKASKTSPPKSAQPMVQAT